jgi:NADPH:quinone reductase-like Zn-dependent oxidoreductase
MKAVRLHEFGGVDALRVEDVEEPRPAAGEVVVAVRAAGIQPGEVNIRTGALSGIYPSTFPHGQGSDLAGVVTAVGPGVSGVAVGDEVLGWVDSRSSHAELVAVPARQVLPKPAEVPWEVAGALFVAGTTAYAAVRAVAPGPGDTVVVSGAAGGVGSVAVQLARLAGARVIGLASPANHAWLESLGVEPLAYDGDVAARLRAAAPDGVTAFVDTFGSGYVDLAIGLGVAPERIDTVVDWPARARYGTQGAANADGASPEVLAELVGLVAKGELEVPVAATYPLAQVRAAFTELERRHTRGKIVLIP